jgi:hypothetical protein
MPFLCQADPHNDADTANDPALMAIHCMGAEHLRAISPGHRSVPVSLRRHRQIHQVARSDQVVKINKQSAIKFIKSNVYMFGVLNRIITDNGSQFTSGAFQGYCEDLGIKICYVCVLTKSAMARWKEPMQKPLKASRLALMMA